MKAARGAFVVGVLTSQRKKNSSSPSTFTRWPPPSPILNKNSNSTHHNLATTSLQNYPHDTTTLNTEVIQSSSHTQLNMKVNTIDVVAYSTNSYKVLLSSYSRDAEVLKDMAFQSADNKNSTRIWDRTICIHTSNSYTVSLARRLCFDRWLCKDLMMLVVFG